MFHLRLKPNVSERYLSLIYFLPVSVWLVYTRSADAYAAKTSLHTDNNGSCSHSQYICMLDVHRKSTIIWRSSAHIFLKSLLHLTDSNASLLSGGIYAKKIIFEKGSFCKNIGYLSWHCRIRYDIRVLLGLSQRSAV